MLSASVMASSVAAKSAEIAPSVMPSSEEQLLQVSIALVVVLAVIYSVAWIIKRNRGIQGLTGLPIKTLAVLPMGVKEKIILIEVGGKQILLGMTTHNINTLASFDEPIVEASGADKISFSDPLKDMMIQAKKDTSAKKNDLASNTQPGSHHEEP